MKYLFIVMLQLRTSQQLAPKSSITYFPEVSIERIYPGSHENITEGVIDGREDRCYREKHIITLALIVVIMVGLQVLFL